MAAPRQPKPPFRRLAAGTNACRIDAQSASRPPKPHRQPRRRTFPPRAALPDKRCRCRAADGIAQTASSLSVTLSRRTAPAMAALGAAAVSGASVSDPFASAWARIVSMISESSMHTMILVVPPQAGQVSISIRKEDRLEALRPHQRGAPFGWRRLLRIRAPDMPASPAPLGRCHPRASRCLAQRPRGTGSGSPAASGPRPPAR